MRVRHGRRCSFTVLCFLGIGTGCVAPDAPTNGSTDSGNPSFTSNDAGKGTTKDAGGINFVVPDAGPGSMGGCVKTTCSAAAATCGPIGDGCGGSLQCGTCSGSETCGGGGTPSQCGMGICTARDCQEAGANCGPVADGCGGMLSCGMCDNGGTCGGDGTPSVCSGTSATCTGLCLQQVQCPAGMATTITGTVHAPTVAGPGITPDPLYGAIVYIPNGVVQAFTPGVACETCGAQVTGDPLATTSSGPDGTYTLSNAPVGSNIPLVIQIGRWRRQVLIPSVAPCVANPIPDDLDRLPRNKSEGDIPAIAMVTGSADSLECTLRKIGIADSEFTNPGGGGRVSMYVNNGCGLDGSTPSMGSLTSSASNLAEYDQIILACAGMQINQATANQNNVINYANLGGRVFGSHFSYVWFYDIQPWEGTATWSVGSGFGGGNSSVTATVDQTFTQGMAFAAWLETVKASTTLGSLSVQQVKTDFTAVTAPAQRWLYNTADNNRPLHYTFQTPVGAATGAQCGRALFSDFHVSGSSGGGGGNCGTGFPKECGNVTAMIPQEKALEFMMFDLASCIPNGGFVIGGQ